MLLVCKATDLRCQNPGSELVGRESAAVKGLGAFRTAIVEYIDGYEFCEFSCSNLIIPTIFNGYNIIKYYS